jgi:hypothetical protein
MTGKNDPVHFAHAVRADRVILTRNYSDFDDLHDLALALRGHQLVVRMENNPRRDLKPHQIVRAINKLVAAGVATADQNYVLNQWR